MAVFFVNNCTYRDCGKMFATLTDLIYHIEGEHLDFDPAVLEHKEQQKPQCVPLSYILKFSNLRESVTNLKKDDVHLPKKSYLSNKYLKEPAAISLEKDTVLVESEVSDDSWNDEYNTENFVHYLKKTPDHILQSKKEYFSIKIKKFACPVPGCNKRYKNINGIKYHTKNGHDLKKSSPVKPKKNFKCHCGKAYKTAQGMKAHALMHKELNMSMHKAHPPVSSPLISGPKVHTINHLVRNNDIVNNNTISITKAEIGDDDILGCSYLEQVPKLSELVDDSNSNLNLLTSPFSYNNCVLNDNFTENLTLDDSNSNSNNYSFTFSYRKC